MISVVIPVLNDGLALRRTLERLLPEAEDSEIIVCDGGSRDGSVEVAESFPRVRAMQSPPGRGRQMNAGAAAATGDILLFLHADTRLDSGWPQAIRQAARARGFGLGAFRFQLDASPWPYRLIEWGVSLRSRLFRLPYGDQALFLRRADFLAAGGFPDLPMMEDVELVWTFRSRGRLVLLPQCATSSARNWERDGLLRRTAGHGLAYIRHRFLKASVSVAKAARWAIVVFCKNPVPGRVKTRLAASIGAERASALYQHLVLRTIEQACLCRGGPAVLVCFDPPHAEPVFRSWLGPGFVYLPQSGGDLGQRMLAAFTTTQSMGFTHTLIVGTDCPPLNHMHLAQALRGLRHADVVLGPTTDGGYYLIGARRPHPGLFVDMPWSSNEVLARTRAALRVSGLRYSLLEPLRDVDNAEDLQHHIAAGLINPAEGVQGADSQILFRR